MEKQPFFIYVDIVCKLSFDLRVKSVKLRQEITIVLIDTLNWNTI